MRNGCGGMRCVHMGEVEGWGVWGMRWHVMRNTAWRGPCWSTSLELGSVQPNTKQDAIILSPRGHIPMTLNVEQVTLTSFDLVAVVEKVCGAPLHVVVRKLRDESDQGLPCWVYKKPLV